jgi:bifunctional UDP-N-acetylglucosamine pyrophosphorylase/glucosamine-1-phosphate N-acetyltransferase
VKPFCFEMSQGAGDGGGECAAVIMAAGKGTRMKSDLAKVLHPLGGRPLIAWVVEAARRSGLGPIILILGHQAEQVEATMSELDRGDLRYVLQAEQNGTGHAVQMARPELRELDGDVVVLSGDVPLIRSETLNSLRVLHGERGAAATVLSTEPADPTGYGRILRDEAGNVAAIREQRDASPAEQAIRETNTGIYCFRIASLLEALAALRPDNDQGEYYLTDTLEILRNHGQVIAAQPCPDYVEAEGINTIAQLDEMERLVAEREV